MENNLYKKTIVGVIFVLGAILTNISFDNILAQPVVENQSAAFPNNTETIQNLENLTGSDQSLLSNDTAISNPNNTLESSLATNQYQSN
jgi:hypothetical protein